jgi:hypothetical protein
MSSGDSSSWRKSCLHIFDHFSLALSRYLESDHCAKERHRQPATLAAILSHSSIRIVQRYVHPTADHKRSALVRHHEIMKATEKKMAEAEGRIN